MRKFINIVALMEGATIHPSVFNAEERSFGWPDDAARTIERDCRDCDGSGFIDNQKCYYCNGTTKEYETIFDFPHIDVSYATLNVLEDIMGYQGGEDEYTGQFSPQELPDVRRRLIRFINDSDNSNLREPSDIQKTFVDHSGEIPAIKTGARMIDFGMDRERAKSLANRLLTIIDYAQKNNLWVSWA